MIAQQPDELQEPAGAGSGSHDPGASANGSSSNGSSAYEETGSQAATA